MRAHSPKLPLIWKATKQYTYILRAPEAILFISRDACSDSITKLFHACFCGVSHNYRAICSKMGYLTDVNRACFPKGKHQNSQKMGEIHELFVLALSLVWFAGATATKEYLHRSGTKIRVFRVAFGRLASHPFSLVFLPLSPSGPVHSSTTRTNK